MSDRMWLVSDGVSLMGFILVGRISASAETGLILHPPILLRIGVLRILQFPPKLLAPRPPRRQRLLAGVIAYLCPPKGSLVSPMRDEEPAYAAMLAALARLRLGLVGEGGHGKTWRIMPPFW